MKYIHEDHIQGDVFTGEYARTIKHLTPSLGVKNVWVGVIEYQPHCTSNMHSHEDQEEVFYCIQGTGEIIVDNEKVPIRPGSCVYVAPKQMHQVVNNTDHVLKVLSAVSPPFSYEQFAKDHLLKK